MADTAGDDAAPGSPNIHADNLDSVFTSDASPMRPAHTQDQAVPAAQAAPAAPAAPPLQCDAHGATAALPPRHDSPSRAPDRAAQRLVQQLSMPRLTDVFKRNLSMTSRRLADPDPSPTNSPHNGPSPSAIARVQSSYAEPPSPTAATPATEAAAATLQRAWRRYRMQTSRSFSAFGGEAMRLVQLFISGAGFVEAAERAASKAHLVLHFDINKTILMSDAAKGAGQADMINMMLSECAWGRMTVGPRWIAVGRLATDRPENDPQLMTYRNFLDSFLHPYVEGAGEAALAENVRRKKLCGVLQKGFTDPGQPGALRCDSCLRWGGPRCAIACVRAPPVGAHPQHLRLRHTAKFSALAQSARILLHTRRPSRPSHLFQVHFS
jgi:hypothetical protein